MAHGKITLTTREEVRLAKKLGFVPLPGIQPGTVSCREEFTAADGESIFAETLKCIGTRVRAGRVQFHALVGDRYEWVFPRGAWSLTIERPDYGAKR